MKRVVVTGMGIWSSIGQDLNTVTESLKKGRSGIVYDEERVKRGLHTGLIGNVPLPDLKPLLPRKYRATMSEDAEYAYMAARQAFEQAGISSPYLDENEVGIIFGTDGNTEGVEAVDLIRREKDTWMLSPGTFFKVATSTVSMNLATIYHLRGINLCVSAGCASASHAIGVATTLIRSGLQSMILTGGASELSIYGEAPFETLNTLSKQNDSPRIASKPFDVKRDGAVISGGAAALLLEEYEHAVARGANIIAEVVGYGFAGNIQGEIYQPSSDTICRAIQGALNDAQITMDDIDYINSCASSSIFDDVAEAQALAKVCGARNIYISSTESMTGHEGWMGGASEAIYSILMMQNNFVAPNINLEQVMEEARDLNIVRNTIEMPINRVLSTSSGLGGTFSALILRKI